MRRTPDARREKSADHTFIAVVLSSSRAGDVGTGVIGETHLVEDRQAAQAVECKLHGVSEVAGALPIIFADTPDVIDSGALRDRVGST